jgi:hypothetical protein
VRPIIVDLLNFGVNRGLLSRDEPGGRKKDKEAVRRLEFHAPILHPGDPRTPHGKPDLPGIWAGIDN